MKRTHKRLHCTIYPRRFCFTPKTKSLWCIGNVTTTLAGGNHIEMTIKPTINKQINEINKAAVMLAESHHICHSVQVQEVQADMVTRQDLKENM